MIKIDLDTNTYTCPYCSCVQAWTNSSLEKNRTGFYSRTVSIPYEATFFELNVFNLQCANPLCKKITVVAFNLRGRQIDIIPHQVIRKFPDYIPEQIRQDYTEASSIISESPKAAATLYRRCLQGMIRDFWGISKSRLYDEINELKDKVSAVQWKAIDGLRKLGNIGAHMEKDVGLIIDIDEGEAEKLGKLIELLLEKWYIARHDEESLLNDITAIADEKKAERGA